MFTAYVIVAVVLAAQLTFSSIADFVRYPKVITAMTRAGVPDSWLNTLASLKAAGALGLLIGIGVPLVGIAAATGVTLFFVGAIVVHVRARWVSIFPVFYLLPALAALVLAVATY